MTDIKMDQDRSIRINWGNFNMPTIGGIAIIIAALYNQGGNQARVDARLDFIETSRTANMAANNARLALIEASVSKVANIEYRITVNESGIVATNARIDRVTDAVGGIRDDIAKVTTAVEVLTEQLKAAAKPSSFRRTELIPIPPALRQ